MGFVRGPELFERAAKTYVLDFGLAKLGFTFKPWFWLVASVMVTGLGLVCRRGRVAVLMLTTSAFVYIAAYFPVIPEAHFRYTHWPAVAVSTAAVLLVVGFFRDKRLSRKNPTL